MTRKTKLGIPILQSGDGFIETGTATNAAQVALAASGSAGVDGDVNVWGFTVVG